MLQYNLQLQRIVTVQFTVTVNHYSIIYGYSDCYSIIYGYSDCYSIIYGYSDCYSIIYGYSKKLVNVYFAVRGPTRPTLQNVFD